MTDSKIALRVVLFEAEDMIRWILARFMRRLGCEVYAFSREGFCPVEKGGTCPLTPDHACADIIITDYHVPQINGLAMIEEHLRKGCKARAIALTAANHRLDNRQRVEELGIRLLEKPFDMDRIELWLREVESNGRDGRKLVELPLERIRNAE